MQKQNQRHTPGPWEANTDIFTLSVTGPDGHNMEAVGGDDEMVEMQICRLFGPDAKDNARLIAAAPELLAACQALLHDAHWSEGAWTIGPMDESKGGKLDMLRTAIAKATTHQTA